MEDDPQEEYADTAQGDGISFYDEDDLNIGEDDTRLVHHGGHRLIRGGDCQYVRLNSLVNNTDCQSGGWQRGNDIV